MIYLYAAPIMSATAVIRKSELVSNVYMYIIMIILHVCIYKNYLDISIIIYWYFDRCYNILSIYQVIMIHFHIIILIL